MSPPYSSATRPYSVSWAAHLGRVGPHLVDLVHRDHDGDLGRQGVVQRLDRLRHHTVVGRHHQHGDVGRLGTPGTHGGERLVARGVDEGDGPLLAVDLRRDLVGADRLGDAPRLARHHVGLADGVQQLGLAVVDVTHHGDHRRPGRQVLLATFVLAELDVEALQQLAVLVLGRDHLDVVVELRAEHLQRVVGDRLGRRHHLAQVEQHLDQRADVGADLLGQVGQRGAPGQPDRLPVTLPDAYAPDLRRLHLVELLTPLLLGLAPATCRASGATERALGTATTAATTATTGRRTARTAARSTATGSTATGAPAGAGPRRTTWTASTARTARTTRTTGASELAGGLARHHRRVRAGHARHAGTAAGCRGASGRRPGAAGRHPPRSRDAAYATDPCPGRRRTGCCPDAGCRDDGTRDHRHPADHRWIRDAVEVRAAPGRCPGSPRYGRPAAAAGRARAAHRAADPAYGSAPDWGARVSGAPVSGEVGATGAAGALPPGPVAEP